MYGLLFFYCGLRYRMTIFAAAFLSLCFRDSNSGTRISVGTTLCVILIFILWAIGISVQLSVTQMIQTLQLKKVGAMIKKKWDEGL